MTKLFRAAFLLLFAVSTSWASNNLPDLGAPDLKDYDAQTETQLGQAFSTALHTYYDLDYDPETLSYIRRIGEKITSQTGKSRYFNFFVIDNPEINAFAGPNGIIGIHTGLIASARSEDELASVIAHEVAHVTQRHLSRTYEYQSEINMTSIASLIAAILIGTQDPSAGIATYMGGMGLSIQQQLKNSRIHENEADYFGIEYLNDAGYNPYAMSDFFARLSKEAQLYEGSMPEILSTHPVTSSRLAKAVDRARQFHEPTRKEKNETLTLIQLRLNFTTNTTLDDIKIKNLTNDQACYLKNLKTLYTYQNQTASFDLQCLNSAIESHPHERLYRLLKAQVKVAQQDAAALKDYDFLEAIYPSDFSIVYLHAKALATLGKQEQAIQLLETRTPTFRYQYLLYSELAKLYAEKQDHARTYYYDALASYNIGNTAKTIYLLKQAKHHLTGQDIKLKDKIKRLETDLGPMDKKRQPS